MTHGSGIPFEVGQPVIVGVGPLHDRRWLRTSVLRVDARIVWLDGAPEDQPTVDVQPGQDVTCHSWRAMDALYQTLGRVAFARLAPEPLIGVSVLSVERIQQREYVRVPLSTEATGLYLGPNGDRARPLIRGGSDAPDGPIGAPDEAEPAPPTLTLTVRDLSAGGLRGRSSLPVRPGDELTIDLRLPNTDAAPDVPVHLRGRVVAIPNLPGELSLRARVVRLIEAYSSDDSHDIGVAFMDVPRSTRERIIRFALDIQRDRRRRGMM